MTRILGPGLTLGLLLLVTRLVVAAPQDRITGAIEGTVFHGGHAASSKVELRLIAKLDPDRPKACQILYPDRIADLAFPVRAEPLAAMDTASDGRYRFEGLALGSYEITARVQEGPALARQVDVLPAEPVVRLDVLIPAGPHVLRGRGLGRDGGPFQGWIALTGDNYPGWVVWYRKPVQPDADGRFEFHDLPPGPVSILALRPGRHLLRTGPVPVPWPDEITLRLEPDVEVEGTVEEEATGRPIPGARLRAFTKDMALGVLVSVGESDAQGRFHLGRASAAANVLVQVEAAGFRSERWHTHDMKETIRFRLRRPGIVAGQVVDGSDGSPVPGIRVFALPFNSDWYEETSAACGRTEADGTFRLEGVPPGEADVFAVGSGWRCLGVQESRSYEYAPLAVRLQPGHAVRTTITVVRDEHPEMLFPATARGHGLEEEITAAAPTPPAPAAGRIVVTVVDENRAPVAEGVVDVDDTLVRPLENGAAGFGPLPAGQYCVRVRVSGYQPWREYVELTGRPGEADAAVTASLTLGLTIAGRALSPEKTPVAWLEVELQDKGDHRARARCLTALDGFFRFDGLPAGDYTIKRPLDDPEYASRWSFERVAVRAGADPIVLPVRPWGPFPVCEEREETPRLVDPEGHPASLPPSHCGEEESPFLIRTVEAEGCEESAFWEVLVCGARDRGGELLGCVTLGTEAEHARDITVRLPKALAIEGTVRDWTGRGVRGLLLRVTPAGAWPHDEVFGREPTWYVSMARTDARERPDLAVLLLCDRPARDMTVQLPRGASVSGVVCDAGGRPVPRARIWRRPPLDRYWPFDWIADRAAEDGSFRITRLGPRPLFLCATAPDAASPGTDLTGGTEVRPGPTDVLLIVPPPIW